MSGGRCPELQASLAACRRGTIESSIEGHVRSCPECGAAVALDRLFVRVAETEAARPFPPAEAVRLESLLVLEGQRFARVAVLQFGIHVLAFTVCVAIFMAAWFLEFRTPATWGGAIAAVVLSMWNLVRAVDEEAVMP